MNDYYQVRVNLAPCCEDATDLLAGMLGDAGFESFVPDDSGLTAYVKAELYDAEAVKAALEDFPFECKLDLSAELVPGQDWNVEWEKHYFQPIVVGEGDDSVVIHSSFHSDVPQAAYDIVIDPKMAFGTGHHATTSLIMSQLLKMSLAGKSVIDMGTGTGILAILAAMRGASVVTAVEIDPFAYENAVDNARLNDHGEIDMVLGDASALGDAPMADLFIANINRNIIMADLPAYVAKLNAGATMLLSGFYEADVPVIMSVAEPLGLRQIGYTVMGDNWTCLRLAVATIVDSGK